MKVHHIPLYHKLLQKHNSSGQALPPAIPGWQSGVHAVHVLCTINDFMHPQGTLPGVMLLMQMLGIDPQPGCLHTCPRCCRPFCTPGTAPPS